ncbi:MAG: ABC transporter ATP-binding protein [Deltaproteobacteria bacterium]|nr:ABC transporter ATP-binding protein [Deltaproteobacteria bacterium]
MVTREQQPADAPLRVVGISKEFQVGKRKVTALKNLSFTIKPGIVTGLIGADGAGKTTLMRLAAGLLVPDNGTISVLGHDSTNESLTVQEMIGYMPQRFGLYEDLTVQENLDLYSDLQGVAQKDRPDRYEQLMEMTGMAPFTDRLAGRLSGGMKQKLGLACTLIRPPRLLLLDEPTVGVDPVSRRELWNIVYHQVENEGMTVLLSTAYLDEAERCGEVVLLHEGKMLGQDPPGEFSKKLAGYAFEAHGSQRNRRALQERLSRSKKVVDAIILGDQVRLVTRKPEQAKELGQEFSTTGEQVKVKAVLPRFEDAFISLLNDCKEDKDNENCPLILPGQIAGGSDEEVIVVKNLQRRFGDFYAVKNLSFTVKRGEIFGLLGANGAGKSTTFRMLCGLLPASEGTLQVAGQDLRVARARARGRIGYMAQKFSLYEGLTVQQNLRFFANAYGLFGKKQKERITWALDGFELQPLRNNISGELPLGFKQRLAMAAALMHTPEILFLDEPTSGVDPLARREFWHRINGLAEAGVTVLVTTHFMEEAEYCDRLVIMARGQVLAAGDPEQLKKDSVTKEMAHPTMEDTFIALIENFENQG